jgi:hypothetical protein
MGVVFLAALARVVCIRTDGDHWPEPSPGAATGTDVERSAAVTMRPLGSDMKVDKNGTIWRGQQPVGVWGVNGGEPGNAAKLLR